MKYHFNKLMQEAAQKKGWTDQYLTEINQSTHEKLMNVDKLADALHEAKLNNEKILIMSDFDMDGIASGTVFFAGLAELGCRVSLYIPDPSEGYGLGASAAQAAAASFPDTDIVLTADVGIQEDIDAIRNAFPKHPKVYVTDHHEPGESMPNADICVDPYAVGDTYAHKNICGAYVAYQVLEDYTQRHGSLQDQEDIERLCLFAGIGTVSDDMDMTYENRGLVKRSLAMTRMLSRNPTPNFGTAVPYMTAFNGYGQLLKFLEDKGKISKDNKDSITEQLYGFYIAPMFNAVKRMDGDMSHAFGVFFHADPSEDIQYLYDQNEKRKELVDKTYEELSESPQPYKPFIYITDAQSGLCGLLANKFLGETGLPTLVLRKNETTGEFSGSARSASDFNILQMLNSVLGAEGAGHAQACGAYFESQKALDDYNLQVSAIMSTPGGSKSNDADMLIAQDGTGDTKIDLDAFRDYLNDRQMLAPFGPKFEEPTFAVKFKLSDAMQLQKFGENEKHFKIILKDGFELPFWNMGDKLDDFMKDPSSTIYVFGNLDQYRDTIQMHISDWTKEDSVIDTKDIIKDTDTPDQPDQVLA